MLEPIRHILSCKKIILASGSPRRKEIISKLGLPFEIVTSTFEENLCKEDFSHPAEYAKETARQKIFEVASRLQNDQSLPDIILGFDTVIALDDTIYEKPKNKVDAVKKLSTLSGRLHSVHTGCVLLVKKTEAHMTGTNNQILDRYHMKIYHESTGVQMGILSPAVIERYVEGGEPMDKAGGYGIQGVGASLVQSVQGDYYNVMGLPLYRVCQEIYKCYEDGLIS